jgi:hypothetical protein
MANSSYFFLKLEMKLFLLFVIFFFLPFIGNSTIYLQTQEDVDSFPINYPGNVVNESLEIRGLEINNLDSLYQIDTIIVFLTIRETSIENLDGLDNLEWIGFGLTIWENEELANFQGLQNLKYVDLGLNFTLMPNSEFPLFNIENTMGNIMIQSNENLVSLENLNSLSFDKIQITNNDNLSSCSIDALCSHILDFKETLINCNGINCSKIEDIIMGCEGYEPCRDNLVVFREDFENWSLDNFPSYASLLHDTLMWQIFTDSLETDTVYSFQFLEDELGETAIQLNSIFGAFVGRLSNELVLEIEEDSLSSIDISFEYCFESLGGTPIAGLGELSINNVLLWNTGLESSCITGCNSKRLVELCDIPANQDSSKIEIRFENQNLFSAVDGTFSSGWVLDNITVKNSEVIGISNVAEVPLEKLVITPNPVPKNIFLSERYSGRNYIIYNNFSQVVQRGIVEKEIKLDYVETGIFYLLVIDEEKRVVGKFIKI